MNKWTFCLVVATWIGTSPTPLWGKRPIPLMPPPLGGYELKTVASSTQRKKPERYRRVRVANTQRPQRAMAARRRVYGQQQSHSSASPLLGGFELGMLGRSNSTSGDIAGLKMLYGGRFFVAIPVTSRIFLKPTLGFFFRKSGEGQLSVTEYMAEAGFGAQYQFARSGKVSWLVGAMSRLEARFSRTAVGALEESASSGDSESSPILFRARLGPTVGLTYRASPNLGLLLDFELSFSLTRPVKPHAGLVAGAVFQL